MLWLIPLLTRPHCRLRPPKRRQFDRWVGAASASNWRLRCRPRIFDVSATHCQLGWTRVLFYSLQIPSTTIESTGCPKSLPTPLPVKKCLVPPDVFKILQVKRIADGVRSWSHTIELYFPQPTQNDVAAEEGRFWGRRKKCLVPPVVFEKF